jgi:hypothetical protein
MHAVMTLRQRRGEPTVFDGRFFEKSPLFWSVAAQAARFADFSEFPAVEDYGRVFDGDAPVRFEAAPPRPRKLTPPIDPRALYDGRITLEAVVPTRRGSWHDFLNALVWGAFPRAKRALHARQHEAIVRALPPEARTLPPARSREHDALALIDEGGVVVLESPRGATRMVFGHALFEGLVLEVRATIARAVVLRVDDVPASARDRIALADSLLASRLEEPLAPEMLPRIALRDCLG